MRHEETEYLFAYGTLQTETVPSATLVPSLIQFNLS
jgi:hypothetical protein